MFDYEIKYLKSSTNVEAGAGMLVKQSALENVHQHIYLLDLNEDRYKQKK